MKETKINNCIFVVYKGNLFQRKGKIYVHTIASVVAKKLKVKLNNSMHPGLYINRGNKLFQIL